MLLFHRVGLSVSGSANFTNGGSGGLMSTVGHPSFINDHIKHAVLLTPTLALPLNLLNYLLCVSPLFRIMLLDDLELFIKA